MRRAAWLLPLTALADTAQATDVSSQARVTADVSPSCQLSNEQDLAFGNASLSVQANGNVAVTSSMTARGMLYLRCSFAYPYKLFAPASANANAAQRRMKSSAGSFYVNYAISAVSSGGEAMPLSVSGATSSTYARTGTGSQEWITVYGIVPAQSVSGASGAAAVAPSAGSYSDIITFTLSF